jgi:hypothetical protein
MDAPRILPIDAEPAHPPGCMAALQEVVARSGLAVLPKVSS